MSDHAQKSPELLAMLQHQDATTAAQAVVDQLHQAIAAQQEKTAQLNAKADSVAQLEVLREDLLADIATGAQGKAAALEVLASRLEKQKKELSEQGTQAAIAQTLAGLNRKLERAQGELQSLQAQRQPLQRRVLRTQAEALGGEYVAAAQQLKALHDRLVSLGKMLHDLGSVPTLFMSSSIDLVVPAFHLESVKPHVDFINPNMLIGREHDSRHLVGRIEREKAALRDLGVEIS